MTSVLNTSLIDKTGPKCSFIEHDTFPIVVKDLRTLNLIKQQVEHQESADWFYNTALIVQ